MATDVDVQYFSHLNGLMLGNNWGDLIRLLDTCLVNGLALPSVTSASIDAQGDITLNLYAAHNCQLFQIVELTGFNSVSLGSETRQVNGKYRIKGVPSANQLILKGIAWTDINPTTVTLVSIGSAKLAPLGYEIIFRDSADVKRVYRAKNPSAQHPFIRLDETQSDGTNTYPSSYAKYAMFGLLEHMDYIDDYMKPDVLQLPFDPLDPAKNWKITGTGGNVVRGWSRWHYARGVETYNSGNDSTTPANGNRFFTICGDADSFYCFNTVTPNKSDAKQLIGCGLYNTSQDSSVIPNWFLMSPTHINNASVSLDHTAISGGWPLMYSQESSKILIPKRLPTRKISNHVFAAPILPDLKSGRSALYSGSACASLEIPFFDSDLILRGSLKHIYYAGDANHTTAETTPAVVDDSMYVYDGTPIGTNTGGCYFYLGELE